MRKVFTVLLVALAIGAVAVASYFILSDKEEFIADTLYDAIPLDAGIIIDVRDCAGLCRALQENRLWKQLCAIPSFAALNSDVALLDSLSSNPELHSLLSRHLIFSMHPSGKEEMDGIVYLRAGSEKEARNITDRLKGQLAGKAVFTERSYDQVNITDVRPIGDNRAYNFSCAYRNGIFVFSRSSILLENAVRQIVADHNIIRQGKLSGLMQTAGKSAPANIYVNYKQLPRAALTLFHAKHHNLIDPLKRYADWTELDLNIKPDILLLNGFTVCEENPEHWLSIFRSQKAVQATLIDAMPSTTYACLWLGIQQLHQYFADYERYLDYHKETSYKKELNRINTAYRIDLQKDFTERFENEAAIVYAHTGQTDETAFTLFRVKSAASAINMLEEWQGAIMKRNAGAALGKETLQFDHQLTFTAYKLPFNVPARLFGDVFPEENNWCVVADNYMVFGKSPADLKKYLHYTALHASLQTDTGYGRLADQMATRSNLTFYCNLSLSSGLLDNCFKQEICKASDEAGNALSKVQAVVFQLNNTNGMLYNSLFVKGSPEGEPVSPTGTQTSWESLLDTAISFKPQLVKNHNTGETEVFIQDMANNIYLLNNVGRILWKVSLPEQIISSVYQIDMYRNGKLQMLFNTPNYIYAIDRLGNFVDKYPVKLESPAVGGLALFDYDSNRNYRIMIACEDRKVYAYEKTGNPVSGWGFRQSEHPVRTDICHYRAENKDYIVFADKYRIYILDRQGRTRITPESQFPVGENTVIALDQSVPKQARLILTDTTGTVHFVSLVNGKMTKQEVKSFPSSHFFAFQDVDGDKKGDFIYATGNKMEVFSQDAKQIMSVTTEETITMRPYVYEFAASDLKIGIVQPQNNHIWLYNRNGKAHKGFPLKGSTLFSIGRIDKSSANFNLFVGSKNNFLYNYSVK
jgi:hypothetical protein